MHHVELRISGPIFSLILKMNIDVMKKYYQADFVEEVQNFLLSLIRCDPVVCI